ncbi:MAG: ATP-binding cassette domain-containing protein [Alphaproteobacteria bacterium]
MSALLQVEGLARSFRTKDGGTIHAVNGVDLTLAAGETLGIVGESGCGKSTLARLILRLVAPGAGRVLFDGDDLARLSPAGLRARRRDMQIVFQDPFASLDPRLTVGSIVAEPLAIHRIGTVAERRRTVHGLLERVGLPADAAARYPHEFSGGQRQRIGIARAIALRPKLVIADEPVSALDVSIRAQILNLLQELKAELGLSYIFISHDLSVVEHVSDRVAVMYLGRIVEQATAEALYARPRHPYTRALIAAIPRPEPGTRPDRAALGGEPPSPERPPPGCGFHPRCPWAQARCAAEAPALRPLPAGPGGHLAACHFAEAIAAGRQGG